MISGGDLEAITEYMASNYTVNPLKSFLTVAFPNSGFTNPAFDKQPEKREAYANEILQAWKSDRVPLDSYCVYTGEPAVHRAFRQHVPLLTGERVVNFHPYGEAGLPVSGLALLAIQALPLGCAKVAGRLLAVHADDPALTYRFARRFLEQNRRAILTAQQAGEKKLPEGPHRAATLLIDTLLALEHERWEVLEAEEPASMTAYHFSNSGQGVDLDIYHLPLEIGEFLRLAMTPRYKGKWDEIRSRGWEIVSGSRSKQRAGQWEQPRYNVLYEDLFRLPDEAANFIRRYFLRLPSPSRRKDPGDPRSSYSVKSEAGLISFDLVDLFLRTVVGMERQRVQRIRQLGDTLAEYVHGENDRRFFRSFATARYPDQVRAALIRASIARVKKGTSPLVAFETYIDVFEEGEDLPRFDWRLARDLVLIRMVERLYDLGWLQSHAEELPEPEDNDD